VEEESERKMKCGWAKASGVRHWNTMRSTARRVYDTGIDGKQDEKGTR
jgi:hypothetical protein